MAPHLRQPAGRSTQARGLLGLGAMKIGRVCAAAMEWRPSRARPEGHSERSSQGGATRHDFHAVAMAPDLRFDGDGSGRAEVVAGDVVGGAGH